MLSSAGTRDSPLTSHGVLQARRLGTHLAGRATTIGPIKQIFASNLSRAVKTAEAIVEAQAVAGNGDRHLEVVQRPELREKDFGSEEGTRFGKRSQQTGPPVSASSSSAYSAPESQDAMRARVEPFVNGDLARAVLHAGSEQGTAGGRAPGLIVVVAHGIILNVLLRCLLTRWGPEELSKLSGAGDASRRRDWLAAWSNTGYLEAEVQVRLDVAASRSAPVGTNAVNHGSIPVPSVTEKIPDEEINSGIPSEGVACTAQALPDAPSASVSVASTPLAADITADIQLSVKRVNCVDHLQGLKKTRGGIGSAGFDAKQKTMDSFFSRPAKKPRKEDGSG